MSTKGCDFVQYSYHKTAHCTTQYDAVHCHLWKYYAITKFCEQFYLV